MESRLSELNELLQEADANERVNRQQWELEREQLNKDKEAALKQVAAKDKEINQFKEQCADLQSLTR